MTQPIKNTQTKPEDSLVQRGVKNPKVIDLIRTEDTPDVPTQKSVVLVMIEDRAWSDSPERYEELSAKFNTYLDYVLDGWLVKQYPQYDGLPVVLELLAKEAPSEYSARICDQMRLFADKSGVLFRIVIDANVTLM